MPTGNDLIKAIKENDSLLSIGDCPGVPARLGKAVYGDWQDDVGEEVIIYKGRETTAEKIREVVQVPDTLSSAHTAVWHFVVSPPVHHFAVVPWYDGKEWVFTAFMAYESNNSGNRYILDDYIKGSGNAPKLAPVAGDGYRLAWKKKEVQIMLFELLKSKSVWRKYFGGVAENAPNKIICYKYSFTSLEPAIQNVRLFRNI